MALSSRLACDTDDNYGERLGRGARQRSPRDTSAVHVQALLVIVFFMIAIARAWRMIGARNTRVVAMVGELLRERNTAAALPDAGEVADIGAKGPVAADGSVARRGGASAAGRETACVSLRTSAEGEPPGEVFIGGAGFSRAPLHGARLFGPARNR
jgi:hypothetical protein